MHRFTLWFRALFPDSGKASSCSGYKVRATEAELAASTVAATPSVISTSFPANKTYSYRQSANDIEWAKDTQVLIPMIRAEKFKSILPVMENELSAAIRQYEGLFEVLLRTRQCGSPEEQLKAAANLEAAQLKVDATRNNLDRFIEPVLSKLDKMQRLILMYKQVKHDISHERQLEFIEAVRAFNEGTKLTKNARKLLLKSKGTMIEEQIHKEIEKFCEVAERPWYSTPLSSDCKRCHH
jgi:hypothetical protein